MRLHRFFPTMAVWMLTTWFVPFSVYAQSAGLSQVSQVPRSESTAPHSMLINSSGADPWVVQYNKKLYYTQTTGAEIKIWEAASLASLPTTSPITVWKPQEGEPYQHLWAPEIHHIQGKWYLYFSADDGNNDNHRMYVLESERGPMGPYTFKGKLSPEEEDFWAIDGTIFTQGDALYFIWSGWASLQSGPQNLYIAKMKNPWTLEGKRTLLSEPNFPWESWINEGPEIIKREGKTFLIYSANLSWTDEYQLGMLKLEGINPMEKDSWQKVPVPVFTGAKEGVEPIFAPGHCTFLEEPQGNSQWILYHVAQAEGSGWNRQVRAQKWEWSSTNEPNFGKPHPLLQ